VVGRAPALLSLRAAAFGALAAALGAYYAWSESLWDAPVWWDVAFLGFVLIPAVFALVWLVLPLRRYRGLPLVGLAFVALAWALHEADLPAVANFAKLTAATALAFWFVRLFEAAAWVALVALLVPWVDAYSVFAPGGPTQNIVEEHPEVFNALSFSFPLPGEHNAAQLGPPDLLFFAFFLAAAAHFGLRVRATWVALALSFGATIAIAVAVDSSGLPALPGLSIAFLTVNADLLWRGWKARGQAQVAGKGTTISPNDSADPSS